MRPITQVRSQYRSQRRLGFHGRGQQVQELILSALSVAQEGVEHPTIQQQQQQCQRQTEDGSQEQEDRRDADEHQYERHGAAAQRQHSIVQKQIRLIQLQFV